MSEARLRSLLEMACDWVWEQDAELRFSYISTGVSKAHVRAKAVIGKRRWELPIQVAPEALAAHRAEVEAHRPFRNFEHQIQGAEDPDDWRWISVSGDPLFDAAGNFLGYRGIGQDITERKRAEPALREGEEMLNRAQAVAHVGSWTLDLQKGRFHWSDETYRIFGIPIGTPPSYELFLACVHPDDRERVERAWQAALKGAPYDIEHRIIVNGALHWVRERAELRFDPQGKPQFGLGTVQDITESKEAAEQLHLLASAFHHSGEA